MDHLGVVGVRWCQLQVIFRGHTKVGRCAVLGNLDVIDDESTDGKWKRQHEMMDELTAAQH